MTTLSTLFIGLGVSAISAATIMATTASIGPLLAASLSGGVALPMATCDEPTTWVEAPSALVVSEHAIADPRTVAEAAIAAQSLPRESIESSIFSPHG